MAKIKMTVSNNITYRDQFNILLEKGYLVQTGGNTFDFYKKLRAVSQISRLAI